MNIETVLVPIDETRAAMNAFEYAVAIAGRYEASVHALYILGESAATEIQNGSIEAESVADLGTKVMGDVRALAGDVPVDHSSACGFSISKLTQHPGSVILDVSEILEVEFIVVPRTPNGDPNAVLGKVAGYVLSYASQPVLSV